MFFPRSCFFAVTAYSIIVFERFSKENLLLFHFFVILNYKMRKKLEDMKYET